MRARLVASVALATLVLVVTSACTFLTPQATTQPYDPSDGVSATLGKVEVLNAIILTDDGKTGSLLINFANRNATSATVNVQYEDASGAKVDNSVYVGANDVKAIGGQGDARIVMTDVDAAPGSLFPVFVQSGSEPGTQMQVPVLDGSLPQYASLLP